MKTESVKLSRSYAGPEGDFDTIELRHPTYKDRYMDGIGAPFDWQPNGRGGSVLVVYPAIVDAYLQKLIVSPGYEQIAGLSALDGGRLEAKLLDFFREAPTPTS